MKLTDANADFPQVIRRIHAAISPRLDQCFEAGNLENLFPLLASWPPGELRLLRRDTARFYRLIAQEIEDGYRRDALSPETLASPLRARQIHEQYRAARLQAIITATEILTAIRFFLDVRYYQPLTEADARRKAWAGQREVS